MLKPTAYIAHDNPARAVFFVRESREHCRQLVAFPEAARLRPELGEACACAYTAIRLSSVSFVPSFLEIRRVVHDARNLADID